MCVLPVVNPSLLPALGVLQAAAGVSAAGYIVATVAFGRAWHLLRLPSLVAMTTGTGGLAVGVVALAGGGLQGIAGWEWDLMLLCSGALPAAGFLIEQRTRPGLRAMVLGLQLPGAAASMGRGSPGNMLRLLEAIEDYDPDLRGHVSRVAALSVRIGMRMRLNASHLREVALAAQLHDIGKIAIPRAILVRASSATAAEFEMVQRHTAYGEQIVGRLPGLAVACRGVGEHHERWDGAGYPYAREGQGISLTARIVAVADAYDALESKRARKGSEEPGDALAEIVQGAGSRFDPRVVDELVRVVGATEKVARAVAA